MDDTTIEGLEVEELDGDDAFAAIDEEGSAPIEAEGAFTPIVPGAIQRWQGQLRRAGMPDELPGPQQRYLDYPAWLTAPHKNPAHDRIKL